MRVSAPFTNTYAPRCYLCDDYFTVEEWEIRHHPPYGNTEFNDAHEKCCQLFGVCAPNVVEQGGAEYDARYNWGDGYYAQYI